MVHGAVRESLSRAWRLAEYEGPPLAESEGVPAQPATGRISILHAAVLTFGVAAVHSCVLASAAFLSADLRDAFGDFAVTDDESDSDGQFKVEVLLRFRGPVLRGRGGVSSMAAH